MTYSDDNLSLLKSTNLNLTGLSLDTSDGKDKKAKKANKALLSELEQLMEVLAESKDAGSDSQTESDKISSILKAMASGTSSTDNDKTDALKAITEFLKKDAGNLGSLLKMLQTAIKDSPEAKEVTSYLDEAKKDLSMVAKAIKDGDTSLEEILNAPGMKAFIGGLSGNTGSTGKSGLGATNTSNDNQTKETHEQKMIAFAEALSSLLSDIYNQQVEQGNASSQALKDQMKSIQTTTAQQIKDIKSEMDQQQKAATKPWWMYLICAVVAIAGAAISVATLGTATGPAVAVVGLVVAGIMMSPVGDMIMSGLTTMFLGGDTNPTDAQKTGAQIGATAVIAVITTLLTLGAGAITSVGEGAAEGTAEGMADSMASSGGRAVAGGAAKATVEIEMTEWSTSALDDGASSVTKTVAKETLAADEKVVKGLLDEAEGSGDDASAFKGSGKKGNNPFSKVRIKKAAFTTGIGKRAASTFISGFLGSGGLQEIVTLIGDAMPNSDFKKYLDSDTGAIVMGVLSAIVSVGVSVGVSQTIGESGIEERAKVLKSLGCGATLGVTKTFMRAIRVIMFAAQSANAGAGVAKYMQYQKAGDIAKLLGSDTASLEVQDYGLQSLNSMQSSSTNGFTKEEESISTSMQGVFNTIGSTGKQTVQQMSR